MAKKTSDGVRFVATRCEVYIPVRVRDDMLEFFAVAACEANDPDTRARIDQFRDIIKSGELV